MNAGEIVGLVVGVLAILAASWRMIRAIYHLVRLGETTLARLTTVEQQLQPNGGNSTRDVLDQVHKIAQNNKAASARLEQKAAEAVVTAGDAAAAAATVKQALDELRDETRERHSENLIRFHYLEGNDEASQIQREFFLRVLKNEYDIDLLPDEDDDPSPPDAG